MKGKIYCSVISRNLAFWNMYMSLQVAATYLGKEKQMMLQLAPLVGDSLVSRARNTALANFLESDCDYMFTLDDDISLPPEALVKLVDADKDIIGGFYRLKQAFNEDNENAFAVRWDGDGDLTMEDIVEVKYVSSGCVMYKRAFLEQMVKDHPELYYKNNVDGRDRWMLYQPFVYKNEYLSEDWAFCQRARDKGHKIWLHGGVRCDHFGIKNYSFEEIEATYAAKKESKNE
jgi:glycosyltransferase involved in cell wall biosynthesis